MDMGMMDGGGSGGLTTDGYDLSNETEAASFLAAILDDSQLQPTDVNVSRAYWYGIVIVLVVAALINVSTRLTLNSRLTAAAAKKPYPAIPSNPYTKFTATATAIVREMSYSQFVPQRFSAIIRPPPVGTVVLLLVYLGFILGLEYYSNFISGAQHHQAFSLRAAWITVAQLPLLFLLAGKNNLIGLVTGVSYERLNVLHRWVSRAIWLTATLHWAYQQHGWSLYGVDGIEKATDLCYPTGVASWTLLTWINVSSIAPLRNWHYEFFVVQHLITLMGFIVAVMIHIPVAYARVYVYIPIGVFLFDRLVRGVLFTWVNSRLSRATISLLPGNVSKIHIQSSRLTSWHAGQHVFLSMPRFGLLQSHPATILSTPSSHGGDLVFILKAHRGFTSRINRSATSSTTSLLSLKESKDTSRTGSEFDSGESALPQQQKYIALLSSPYGCSHSDFAAFSSTLLIAGSTGITFTLPLLLNIAERAQKVALPLRHLSFLWIIKSSTWTCWASEELTTAVESLKRAGIECKVNIFVTCDEAMTDSSNNLVSASTQAIKSAGCPCNNTEGPCCCTVEVESGLVSEKADGVYDNTKPVSLRSNSITKFAALQSGRPAIEEIIWETLDDAEGETGIAVCGPLGLSTRCRRAVAKISDDRGVHKGTGAQGVYLHVEGFGW